MVDPVTPLDLAILLWTPRLDIAMPNPSGLDCQGKRQRKLPAVVALESANRERERSAQFGQEGQARGRPQSRIETQHPIAGAVVEGGVLERPAAPQADELHIHLHAVPRIRSF